MENLPSEILSKDQWEMLGFEFGAPLPQNLLFCLTSIPEGWKVCKTDYVHLLEILDDQNNVRGSYYHNLKDYVRNATLYSPLHRYFIRQNYEKSKSVIYKTEFWEGYDRVTNTVIFTVEHPSESGGQELAARKLTTLFPDWENPSLYWP